MSNFPSDPSINTRHTVGRRLWTFDGEGWRRGFREYPTPPAPEPGPETDPLWASVYILCKCDGTPGSTSFIDSGPGARVLTPVSSANLSNTQVKFGSASGRFQGSGQYVAGPSDLVDELANDFCYEVFVYSLNNTGNRPLFALGTGLYNRANVTILGSDLVFYTIRGFGTDALPIYATGATPPTGSWNHFALDRNGNTVRLFVNGNLVGSVVSPPIPNVTGGLFLFGGGSLFSSNISETVDGYLDEVRFTRASRYTANFAPPTKPFPTQ